MILHPDLREGNFPANKKIESLKSIRYGKYEYQSREWRISGIN